MSSVNWNTWKIEKGRLCAGGLIESFKNLQDAKKACVKSSACGCVSDDSFQFPDDDSLDFTTNKFPVGENPATMPVDGVIAYVRLHRTKGIHSNILILKSYKSNKILVLIKMHLIFIIIIRRMDQNDEQILLRRSHSNI